MVYLYLPIEHECFEWEDLIIYKDLQKVIDKSLKNPKIRFEIFKEMNCGLSKPTYAFIQNGKVNIQNKMTDIQLDLELIKLTE